MDHRIYFTVVFVCFVIFFIMHALIETSAAKKNGHAATIGGLVSIVGFLTIVVWVIHYTWS